VQSGICPILNTRETNGPQATINNDEQFPVSRSHENTEARHEPRLREIYFSMPLWLRMEVDVAAADYASGPDLGHRTGNCDTELIVCAGLAIVFHG